MTDRSSTLIAVCVITYRRPASLDGTLASLAGQEPIHGARLVVCVCDNDPEGSAEAAASRWSGDLDVRYVRHSAGGIPGARNAAFRQVPDADLLLTIDDDEIADPAWLRTMLTSAFRRQADILTGPVVPRLPPDAPRWARGSGLLGAAPEHPDGMRLPEAFSGNMLVHRRVLDAIDVWFDESLAFTGGTDTDFTRRAAARGFVIEWVADAVVHEDVHSERLTLSWVVRRGFRIGNNRLLVTRRNASGPFSRLRLALLVPAEALVGLALTAAGIVRPRWFAEGLSRLSRAAGSAASLLGTVAEPYRSGR